MGKYKYFGIKDDGKKVEGEIDADSLRDAKKLLRRQGIRPSRMIAPSALDIDLGQWMVDKGLASPFGLADLMRFTRRPRRHR